MLLSEIRKMGLARDEPGQRIVLTDAGRARLAELGRWVEPG
jgi:hypothetical protein